MTDNTTNETVQNDVTDVTNQEEVVTQLSPEQRAQREAELDQARQQGPTPQDQAKQDRAATKQEREVAKEQRRTTQEQAKQDRAAARDERKANLVQDDEVTTEDTAEEDTTSA